MQGNCFGKVVIKFRHDGNGTIASGLLKPRQVVHIVAIAFVHRIFLLIQPVVQIIPSYIFVLVAARGEVVHDNDLRFAQHLLSCGNIERAVDDLTEHIHPHILEAREAAPVTMCVAIDLCIVEVLEIFCPDELWPVPYSTTIDTALLHDRGESGGNGIFLAAVFAKHHIERSVPSTVVIADTIVVGQPGNIGSPGDTLGTVETRRRRVFIEP